MFICTRTFLLYGKLHNYNCSPPLLQCIEASDLGPSLFTTGSGIDPNVPSADFLQWESRLHIRILNRDVINYTKYNLTACEPGALQYYIQMLCKGYNGLYTTASNEVGLSSLTEKHHLCTNWGYAKMEMKINI